MYVVSIYPLWQVNCPTLFDHSIKLGLESPFWIFRILSHSTPKNNAHDSAPLLEFVRGERVLLRSLDQVNPNERLKVVYKIPSQEHRHRYINL